MDGSGNWNIKWSDPKEKKKELYVFHVQILAYNVHMQICTKGYMWIKPKYLERTPRKDNVEWWEEAHVGKGHKIPERGQWASVLKSTLSRRSGCLFWACLLFVGLCFLSGRFRSSTQVERAILDSAKESNVCYFFAHHCENRALFFIPLTISTPGISSTGLRTFDTVTHLEKVI